MTNRPWGVHRLQDMVGPAEVTVGRPVPTYGYVRAVPEPYGSNLLQRIRAAWWVLTNRAEAVVWPESGDFEKAYYDDRS